MKTLREYIDLIAESTEVNYDWFKAGAFKTFKKPAEEKYEIATEPGTVDTLEV